MFRLRDQLPALPAGPRGAARRQRRQQPAARNQGSIPGLRSSVTFARGQQYRDFDADIDEVAAYSIGGLVAGKVLAKVGLFAVVLKFWRIGLPALAGAWAVLKRFFGFGQKEA